MRRVGDLFHHLDAGVVHQHIEAAEGRDRLLDRGHPLFLAGDVQVPVGGRATGCADRFSGFLPDSTQYIRHQHAGTRGCENPRRLGADAAGATRDQRHLAVEAELVLAVHFCLLRVGVVVALAPRRRQSVSLSEELGK